MDRRCFLLGSAALAGCATQAPGPQSELVGAPTLSPPSTPPPPPPPPPPDNPAFLAGPEPALQPSGDPRFDAWRLRVMEYWGEGWRPYLVRLLHDMRPIRVEPEPWAALSDPTAAFVAEVVTPDKIARGRAHAAEAWLREIASRRGIPAVVLAAVWGAESDFGRREGAYDLLAFWATRASVGDSIRDPDFGEAAKIVVAGDIPRARLRAFPDGSTGQVRWFPKQYMEMAVDADDDSVRDIWRSRIDAMDSVAARLAGAWRAGEWLVEVEVPQGQDIATQRLLRGARTPSGVQPDYFRRKDGRPWAAEDLRNGGRLLEPYGPGGPAYLGFGNLQVLQYLAGDYRGRFPGEDRAAPWALAIGLLANRIAGR